MKSSIYLLSIVILAASSSGIVISSNLPEHTRLRRPALGQLGDDILRSDGDWQRLLSKQGSAGDSFTRVRSPSPQGWFQADLHPPFFQDQATDDLSFADVGFDDSLFSKRKWSLDVEDNIVNRKAWESKHSVRMARRSAGDQDQKPNMTKKSVRKKSVTIKELQRLVDSKQATPEQIEDLNKRRAVRKEYDDGRYAQYKELEAKVKAETATADEILQYERERPAMVRKSQSANASVLRLRKLVRDKQATPQQMEAYKQLQAREKERPLKYAANTKTKQEALWASEGPPVDLTPLHREYKRITAKNTLERQHSGFCYACRTITNWVRTHPGANPNARTGRSTPWDYFIIPRIRARGVNDDPGSFCTILLHQMMSDEADAAAASFLQNLSPPVPISSPEVQRHWEQETRIAVRKARDKHLDKVTGLRCDGKRLAKELVTDPSAPSTDKQITPAADSNPAKAPDSEANKIIDINTSESNGKKSSKYSMAAEAPKTPQEGKTGSMDYLSIIDQRLDTPKAKSGGIRPDETAYQWCDINKDDLNLKHDGLTSAEIQQLYDFYCASKASSQHRQTSTSTGSDDHRDEAWQNTFSAKGSNSLRRLGKAAKDNLKRVGSNMLPGLGGVGGRVAPPMFFEPGMPMAW
ncbi:MAG: hypothetical protein M1816_003066 [Peltula sp. TS41687]|nr:MAG: hypothetical protein M1816_003066 [Peltula sp. TS41687]